MTPSYSFVFSHVTVFVRPMLDVHPYRRAGENDVAHPSEYDDPTMPDHDLAQGSPRASAPLHALAPIGWHMTARESRTHQQASLSNTGAISAAGHVIV
jgi:hypothetical protein